MASNESRLNRKVITYLNLPSMLRMAIYLEVMLSSIQNLINVISNIVSLAEDEGVC